MPKVSVIVPIYNVEPYLARCLDSLLGQTLQDVEIVLVNDGSTDGSAEIATEYERRCDNVRAYTKENGGLASARNYGLPFASGEYIAFIDSDDWLDREALEKLYGAAVADNADIVVCDMEQVDENGCGIVIPQLNKSVGDMKKAHMIASPGFCNRIFKKAFLDRVGFRFFEGIYFEDLAVHATLVAQAQVISYVERPFYKYFVRQGSITHQSQKNDKLLDALISVDHLYENFNRLPCCKEYQEELEYIHVTEYLYAASFRLLKYKDYDGYVKKIAQTLSRRFPRWRKNKYYKTQPWKYKVVCNLLYGKHLWLLRKLLKH